MTEKPKKSVRPRRERIRRGFGPVRLPHFVWEAGRVSGLKGPGALLSALHTGYVASGAAVVIDIVLLLILGTPNGLVLILSHLVWISLFVSIVLLNPSFLEDLEGRPLSRLGPANVLTLCRIFFLPLLLYLVLVGAWPLALAGYVVLGLTDVADGAVARLRREESKLGYVLDPFGDLLFHLGIFLSLAIASVLPVWAAVLVAIRYGLLLLGCGLLYALKGEIWIQPTLFGKTTGLFITILATLLMLFIGIGMTDSGLLVWLGRILGLLYALGIAHVLIIGWINFRRPVRGGTAVYRRNWGLSVGRRRLESERDR